MNGQLSDQPLAELVREISDAQLSGALRLERERAKGAVYFDGGRVAAALSNLRPFRLVEVLRRSGAVDPVRLYAVVGDKMSDEEAGTALLRAGFMDEAGLRRIRERQSKEVLGELLRWTSGEWAFDARVRLAGAYAVRLDASGLLAEAARNFSPELVAERMRDDEETLAPAADINERIAAGLRLLPSEGFVLSRFSGPMRLGEVVAISGLPEEDVRRAAYVLALGGLLARPDRPHALPEDVLRRATAQAAPAAPGAATQEASRQTGERELPSEPAQDTRGTVEELLERAQGASFYEVLGVRHSASADEVKQAYYSHARRLHPDRFRRDADEETRQRIDTAFARIAQAYDTLSSASRRAAYDLKLSKQRGG